MFKNSILIMFVDFLTTILAGALWAVSDTFVCLMLF
jgi:hypothetical protein